jgi:carboxyl-terminal processing protease
MLYFIEKPVNHGRGAAIYALTTGYLVIAPLLLSLLSGGCAVHRPIIRPIISVPGTNEHLEVLADTYFLIKKYYVDPVTPAKLSASAIRGMEEFASSKSSALRKPVFGSSENTNYEEEALKTVGAAFGSFVQASNLDPRLLEQAAIKGMIKSLDPHTAFMTPEMYKEMQVETKKHVETGGIGLQIGTIKDRMAVIAPIEGSPADKAGIKAGDYITKINDDSIQGLNLIETIERLRGPIGSKMSITLERKGEPEPLSLELVRDVVKIETTHSRTIEEKIGYVRLTRFHEGASNDLKKVLQAFQAQGIQAFILDLRNNSGGLVTEVVDVAEQFLDRGKLVVSLKYREGRKDEFFSRSQGAFRDVPMIVLINRGTAAGSEIVAGALQDYGRAKMVGTPTFGSGTVQTILPLSGGAGLRLTTAKFFTPNGRSIESKAIQPDLMVQEEDGIDAALSSAVGELRTKLRG